MTVLGIYPFSIACETWNSISAKYIIHLFAAVTVSLKDQSDMWNDIMTHDSGSDLVYSTEGHAKQNNICHTIVMGYSMKNVT